MSENVSWTDMELLKKHFTRRPLNKTGMMSGKKRHNTNNSKVRASQLTEYKFRLWLQLLQLCNQMLSVDYSIPFQFTIA